MLVVLLFTSNIGEAIELRPPSTLKLSPHMLTCWNGSYISINLSLNPIDKNGIFYLIIILKTKHINFKLQNNRLMVSHVN